LVLIGAFIIAELGQFAVSGSSKLKYGKNSVPDPNVFWDTYGTCSEEFF